MTVIDCVTTSTAEPLLSSSVKVVVPEPSLSPRNPHDTLEVLPGPTDPIDWGFDPVRNRSSCPGDHETVTVNPVAAAPPVLVTVAEVLSHDAL